MIEASVSHEIDSTEIKPSDLVCHNVLAIAEVNVELDLEKVISGFKNAEYDSAKFNCVRVRDWTHKCTVAIFASGKLQVTGASNPENAKTALKFAAYRLKNKIGYSEIIFSNIKIDNILATFDIGTRMDLYGISRDPLITCTYMPSQFAAAVVREVRLGTGVVIDVFASGKMNVKGKDSLEKICIGVNELMPKIAKHICESLDHDDGIDHGTADTKRTRL